MMSVDGDDAIAVDVVSMHKTFKHFWRSTNSAVVSVQLDLFLHVTMAPGANPKAPPSSAVIQLIAWDSTRMQSQSVFFSYKR